MGPQFDYGFEMRGQPDTQRVYDAAQNLIERLVNFIQAKIAAVQAKSQGVYNQIISSLSAASQAKAEQANKTIQTIANSIDAQLAEQIGGISERLTAYTAQLRPSTPAYGASGAGYSNPYQQPTVPTQPSAGGQPMPGLASNAAAGPTVPYSTPIVPGPAVPTQAVQATVSLTGPYWIDCGANGSPVIVQQPIAPSALSNGPYTDKSQANQAMISGAGQAVCNAYTRYRALGLPIPPATQPTTPAPTPPPSTVPTVPPTTPPPTTPPTPATGASYYLISCGGMGGAHSIVGPISADRLQGIAVVVAGPFATLEEAKNWADSHGVMYNVLPDNPCYSAPSAPTPPPPTVDCPDWAKACIDYALKGLKDLLDKTPPLTGDPVLDIVSGNMDEDKGELTKLDPQFIGPMFDANSGDDLSSIVEKSDYWQELLG